MPSTAPSSAFSATIDNDKATRALAVCIGAGEKAAHGRENAQQDVEKVDKSGNRADGGVGMIFVAAVVVGWCGGIGSIVGAGVGIFYLSCSSDL